MHRYEKEKARRGYVPGNWKWIITPVSPTASRCYLELNKMTEFTLKPVSSCLSAVCFVWCAMDQQHRLDAPGQQPA